MASLIFQTAKGGTHRVCAEPDSVGRVIRQQEKHGNTLLRVVVGGTTHKVDARLSGDKLIAAARRWCKAAPQLPGLAL